MASKPTVLPALEQGFHPLTLSEKPPIPLFHLYSRMRLTLIKAVEKYAQRACLSLIPSLDTQDQRRDTALLGRIEGQQSRFLSLAFEPPPTVCHSILDTAIGLLNLSAMLAQGLPPGQLRSAVEFSIPEYTDFLYRIANALRLFYGASAQEYLQGFEEILPGRPTVASHRHPYDDIRTPPLPGSPAQDYPLVMLIAAEEALCNQLQHEWPSSIDPVEKALYQELAQVCHQHLSQYQSLLAKRNPLDMLLLIQYTEGYLYTSFQRQETDPLIQSIYAKEAEHELSHIAKAADLIARKTGVQPTLPPYPDLLCLQPCKGYIRDMLQHVGVTVRRDAYRPVGMLPKGADFFRYQKKMCNHPEKLPSHIVIEKVIATFGTDERFEIAPHPVEALRIRKQDIMDIGR